MSHQLRIRRAGMRAPLAGAALVARPSRWGNPYRVGVDGTATEVVAAYERWLRHQPQLLAQLPVLRGRRLACYCPLDQPCHADVLARLAND
jgi:hypothetical protein